VSKGTNLPTRLSRQVKREVAERKVAERASGNLEALDCYQELHSEHTKGTVLNSRSFMHGKRKFSFGK
jgi:hypothetical protein